MGDPLCRRQSNPTSRRRGRTTQCSSIGHPQHPWCTTWPIHLLDPPQWYTVILGIACQLSINQPRLFNPQHRHTRLLGAGQLPRHSPQQTTSVLPTCSIKSSNCSKPYISWPIMVCQVLEHRQRTHCSTPLARDSHTHTRTRTHTNTGSVDI